MSDRLADISTALATHGLTLRGGFNFDADDDSPAGPSGAPAKSVLLVGQAGAAPWPHFKRWRKARPADLANPLDTWSREVIGAVGKRFGARAAMPNDQPYLPFQQWAMRAEGLRPSPLGILIHPEYGLWHAYRGALLLDETFTFPPVEKPIHLCDLCASKPCLNACPVGAFSGDTFAYEACIAHVRGPAGESCREGGCLARNACPHGGDYRYPREVQAFHQRSFAGLPRPKT
ncbi:hypothetical protein [Aquamicrobium sp. LC103]|uniref:hypothetical protein n=1 Tax=Aquamicrobium sp. LC103 TaxID=1120658 RepID=UPI00063ED2BF|nr:hypothetical protein [Aquamicrobium sp. LC103]TKT80040.1 hypothetical protein XW59_006685 [Aquamicrobium sp. LC103]